jgi:hypothetical protein
MHNTLTHDKTMGEMKIETVKHNGVVFQTKYHFTAKERKFIKLAYDFCKENNVTCCKINTFIFRFNFEEGHGHTVSAFETGCARRGESFFRLDADGEVKFPFDFTVTQ